MERISAVVITLNESRNIEDCLNSLSFVDEIIVVDSGSTDRTVELARKFTDNVFSIPWQGYADAKNFGIDHAAHDWILSIDADERVSSELRSAICSALSPDDLPAGFRMRRRTWYIDRWISGCGWYPDWNIRLFDRRKARFNAVSIHEKVVTSGEIRSLEGDILHYSYSEISDHLKRIDKYTGLIAEQWVRRNRRPGVGKMIFRPVWEFFRKYILQGGFKDGITGCIVCGLHAHYVFLKYAKTYELFHKREDEV